MSLASTIQEFLVELGYSVDTNGGRRFDNRLKQNTQAVGKLNFALFALAAAADTAVRRMADDFEKLYYSSQRVNSSVRNIEAFRYAVSQMGGSADAASASLAGFARKLRENPAMGNFIQGRMGVSLRNSSGQMRQWADVLVDIGDKLRAMPYWKANVYAKFMGLGDENTVMAMLRGVREYRAQYDAIVARSGVNLDQVARKGVALSRNLRTLGTEFKLVGIGVGSELMSLILPAVKRFQLLLLQNIKPLTAFLSRVSKIVVSLAHIFVEGGIEAFTLVARIFDRLNDATGGWAGKLLGLIAAWRILNFTFMATPLGRLIALGTALISLYDDYKVWKAEGKSLINWSAWKTDIDHATTSLDQLGDKFIDLKKKFDKTFPHFASYIKTVFLGVLRLALTEMLGMANVALDLIQGNFTQAQKDYMRMGNKEASIARGVGSSTVKFAQGIGGAGAATTGAGGNSSSAVIAARTRQALRFFVARGYSKQDAAGIVANLLSEDSTLAPDAVNKTSGARGIAQWLGTRVGDFNTWASKTGQKALTGSSLGEQLAFVDYELHHKEAHARRVLESSPSPYTKGYDFNDAYERNGDGFFAKVKRGFLAGKLYDQMQGTKLGGSSAGVHITLNSKTDVHVAGGSTAAATGHAVASEQGRVNADTIRNLRSVTQ